MYVHIDVLYVPGAHLVRRKFAVAQNHTNRYMDKKKRKERFHVLGSIIRVKYPLELEDDGKTYNDGSSAVFGCAESPISFFFFFIAFNALLMFQLLWVERADIGFRNQSAF